MEEADQTSPQNPLLTRPALGTATRSGTGAGLQNNGRAKLMQPDELKAIRKGAGMTQHQLAEAIGLSHGYIGEMERGEKPIEKRTALAVIHVTQCQKQ